jgi:hypothetical protein
MRNPAIVGEDDSIVSRILFAEATSNVVRCSWAVPDHAGASIEMASLLRARACVRGTPLDLSFFIFLILSLSLCTLYSLLLSLLLPLLVVSIDCDHDGHSHVM